MKHPPAYPDLIPTDFWLFPKIKSALKGRIFQDIYGIQRKCDDGTEIYSTTGVPKNVSNSCSIVGLRAELLKGSTTKVTPHSKL
jgi:hypothetical protein